MNPPLQPETRTALRVDIDEPRSLLYWCRELHLSYEQLRHVIEATGTSVEKIRNYLDLPLPARAA